jgi:hypothetical protein
LIAATVDRGGAAGHTRAMDHVEEATWTVRVEASARFPEDYDGDDDGFAWRDRLRAEVLPRLTRAILRELASTPGWRVRPASRGLSGEDELLVRLERVVGTAEAALE